jgi:hypothetical protein
MGAEKCLGFWVGSEYLDPGECQHLMTYRPVSTMSGVLAGVARING